MQIQLRCLSFQGWVREAIARYIRSQLTRMPFYSGEFVKACVFSLMQGSSQVYMIVVSHKGAYRQENIFLNMRLGIYFECLEKFS